jgi:hypothetical protein
LGNANENDKKDACKIFDIVSAFFSEKIIILTYSKRFGENSRKKGLTRRII